MARWKRPCASVIAISCRTDVPPADSPKIVTFFGSQCRDLIHQPVIANSLTTLCGTECRVSEEAKATQAVVEGDDSHSTAGQRAAIEHGLARGTHHEAADRDPDHLRQLCARTCRRAPHVDEEAVLADGAIRGRVVPRRPVLHAIRAEFSCLARCAPRRRALRRTPAQGADRRGGVGNAEKTLYFTIAGADQSPGLDAHFGRGQAEVPGCTGIRCAAIRRRAVLPVLFPHAVSSFIDPACPGASSGVWPAPHRHLDCHIAGIPARENLGCDVAPRVRGGLLTLNLASRWRIGSWQEPPPD
jgi:hypothetical protein